jgi:hypothetical protein
MSALYWSTQQKKKYTALVEATSALGFRDTAKKCFSDAAFSPHASPEEISDAEAKLQVAFPEELKRLYLETNGIKAHYSADLIMSLADLVSENLALRNDEAIRGLYMPFDNLLMIGRPGNGDLFCYPIRADGSIPWDVFLWDHENDSRSSYANGVKDLFLRHVTNLSD